MRIAIGQFGGPTTVLNASLYGALAVLQFDAAGRHHIFGIAGGMTGLLEGRFLQLDGFPAAADATWLLQTPGAALKSGRAPHSSSAVEAAVQQLKKLGADGLLLLGGNGTMGLAHALEQTARAQGYSLQVIGVPKTIDNDICGVDHTPGFPSAARFVIQAIRDLTVDLEAMAGFEQVRVVEVMGRHTGWLAAAASLTAHLPPTEADVVAGSPIDPAWFMPSREPILCLPETPVDFAELRGRVEQRVCQYGSVVVVVGEGVQDRSGKIILETGGSGGSSSMAVLGGAGRHIARALRRGSGWGVRSENLGLLQRCSTSAQLDLDRREAEFLGRAGVQALLNGGSGVMVGLERSDAGSAGGTVCAGQGRAAYATRVVSLPLAEVAGRDRRLEGDLLEAGAAFRQWLAPLIDLPSLRQHPIGTEALGKPIGHPPEMG